MSDINGNPLKEIFKQTPKGEIIEEMKSINKIDLFFKYIIDENISSESRSKVIEILIEKLKINRYLSEYFSTFENESVYLVLTKLYLNKSSNSQLKASILNLISELRINLDINKNIYDYIFQKISLLYRGNENLTKDDLQEYLILLENFLGETINSQKPRNYFSCSGEGFFEVDMSNLKLNVGCSFTLILNFKIGNNKFAEGNPQSHQKANLININFSNGYSIDIDFEYPMFLVVKEIQDKFIKTLPVLEWMNLIINIVNDDKNTITAYFYTNGENRLVTFPFKNPKITNNDTIKTIKFFNNFYGEVSSMTFLSQKDYGYPGVNASDFLLQFRQYQEGLWKRKKINNFINLLSDFDSIGIEKTKSKTVFNKHPVKLERKIEKEETSIIGKLSNNLIFIFTPINYYTDGYNKNLVENVLGNLSMKFYGNIRPHKYYCFQKRIGTLGVINNLLPIAEMFVIHPKLLNEKIFETYLNIIKAILNERKHNMQYLTQNPFFQILSLFFEKYPKHIFTKKILDTFAEIGKCLLAGNVESLTSLYFEHILLNEKILLKYSEPLQIEFWNHILLFCQLDSSQIEVFINMNRICLILRFYDRNKYSEICCKRHMSVIKDEFIGNKVLMNPPMNQKLLSIQNILNVVISSQEPEKAFLLFKLLTLDLSPCLTEFILNIFINEFQKRKEDKTNWKDRFIDVLVNNKFETIIANTLLHSLPEIKLSLLTLITEISFRLAKNNKIINFKAVEKIIKQLILPQDNFYAKINNDNSINLRNSTRVDFKGTKKLELNKNNNEQIKSNEIKNDKLNNIENKKEKEEKLNNNIKKDVPEIKKVNTISSNKVSSMISKFEGMKNKIPGLGKPKQPPNQPQKKEPAKIIPQKPEIKPKPPIEKTLLTEDQGNDYKLNYQNEKGEVIIFKNNIYFDYVESIYKLFFLWSINQPPNSNFYQVDFKKATIESTNALEFLLSLSLDINDLIFYIKCMKNIYILSNSPLNCFRMLSNTKIISLLLDINFKYYRTKDKKEDKCFNMIKSTLLNIYMNSIAYSETNQNLSINPCDKIDILFLWGDKTIFGMKTKNKKDEIFDFLNEFLMEFLTTFKIKYERFMDLNLNAKGNNSSNPDNNYHIKNYFIIMTHLFRFSFYYKHDEIIQTEGLTFIDHSANIITYLIVYITGMRLNPLKGEKMIEQWIDYPFFDDMYRRLSFMWNKIKNYNEKKKDEKKKKQNKVIKYEKILNKVILDKDKKNIYQKELELLCYEGLLGEKEIIIPLIKIIPIQLMCVIKSSETEENFRYWLKEFKKFIRFIIIASSNLARANQLDLYIKLQEKCWITLAPCIAFLKDLIEESRMCKEKIQSTLQSLLLFCCIIVKYQYDYIDKHKGIKKIKINKLSRNDLIQSAVFILFTEIIKDNTGVPLLNEKAVNSLSINQYYAILGSMIKKEWKEAFFENVHIRERLYIDFFQINNYKKIVDSRINQIKLITIEKDEQYKDDILQLLPLYEKELLKYSNNSLEKNKKIKSIYKKFKKKTFSWNGFWSDRDLFFEHQDKLKLKVMNHLTKTLMKPVLEPILDISYYLPAFSGFNPQNLFNPDKNENKNKFKLIMDIDKILKSSEQSMVKEIKNKLIEEKNEENFLRNVYAKSNPELAESFQKIANSLDFGKEEEFAIIQDSKSKTNKKEKKYFLSCLVKTSHHIKGVCFIDNNCLNFKVFLNQKTGSAMSGVEIGFTSNDEDYDPDRHTCFGSYFVFHPKDKDIYKINIHYNDIKWIFRRRYYYKNSALEIFTTTNKTFYFNFKFEDEREIVIEEIIKKLNEPAKIIDDLKDSKDNFENVIGFENVAVTSNQKKSIKRIKISQKIELWKEWKMTNYEFLMWMNIYGNRSFNDISQYPVFPWILNDYKDPLKKENDEQEQKYDLRDMSLPMGMMTITDEAEARKEMFIENFETLKETAEDGLMKPYFYGSNYSNPIYVCHFLMRVFPFTQIAIELQGSKFDHAERLFLSVEDSFTYSITQKTDVRELIPEFFYLPEIFLNINDLNMGALENGQKVNDILVPCQNNPYEFVETMKTILESDEISNVIQNWIDLIFGSKSKGKEAENAKNVFTEESYQENLDITKAPDKEATLRKVEFGLIPSQVMSKDCGKRDKKEELLKGKEITDPTAVLVKYECKSIKEQGIFYKYKDLDISVLYGVEIAPDRIMLVLSNNFIVEKKINLSSFTKEFTDEIITTSPMLENTNKMVDYYTNNSQINKAIVFLIKLKILIVGGYYDGKINLYFPEDKTRVHELIPFESEFPVTSLSVGSDEEYLFVGNSIGNVVVYKINYDVNNWKIIKNLKDQRSPISHIYSNGDLNLWLSTSIDGYINLYTLPLCKLARTIKISTKKCSYAFLSSSPLPSIVVINDETNNSEISVYSINGKFISKNQLYFQLNNPIIIKDLNANEYLCYIGKEAISILGLPNLELMANIDIKPGMGLYNIFSSRDKISLYCLNKSGSKVYVIRDEVKKVHEHA